MATPEQTKSLLVNKEQVKSLRTLIEESAKELGRALPEHLNPERIVRIALTSIRLNPELSKCTQESFLGALFVASQLGVEPIGGRAYLLPFNNSRKIDGEWKTYKECTFVIGFRGIVDLFYRHSKSVKIEWGIVRDGDDFDYAEGTDPYIKHRPKLNNKASPIAFYTIATLHGGAKIFKVMGTDECREHGLRHSKTVDKKTGTFRVGTPWETDFTSMALKTCLIQLAKILPLSIELQRAIDQDETSREYRKGVQDMLDTPSTTTWTEPAQIETTKEKDPNDPGEPPPETGKSDEGKAITFA